MFGLEEVIGKIPRKCTAICIS